MKRYRQIEQSKARIFDTFADLLQRFNYRDITLSEIADHAGLTRMTLYRHFKTKDDIIGYRAQRFRDEADRGSDDIEKVIFRRYQLAMNLPRVAILANRPEIHTVLAHNRMQASIGTVERYTGRRFEDDPYLFRFFFGGLHEIVTRWFQAGCDATPQEMTRRTMLALEMLVAKSPVSADEQRPQLIAVQRAPIEVVGAGKPPVRPGRVDTAWQPVVGMRTFDEARRRPRS